MPSHDKIGCAGRRPGKILINIKISRIHYPLPTPSARATLAKLFWEIDLSKTYPRITHTADKINELERLNIFYIFF